ncbi:MAG: hypothetical protein AB7S26_16695 [Sandaracinaceae bacterium]
MTPARRALLDRYRRVLLGLAPIGIVAVLSLRLTAASQHPLLGWLRDHVEPRTAFSVVFVIGIALIVLVRRALERRR